MRITRGVSLTLIALLSTACNGNNNITGIASAPASNIPASQLPPVVITLPEPTSFVATGVVADSAFFVSMSSLGFSSTLIASLDTMKTALRSEAIDKTTESAELSVSVRSRLIRDAAQKDGRIDAAFAFTNTGSADRTLPLNVAVPQIITFERGASGEIARLTVTNADGSVSGNPVTCPIERSLSANAVRCGAIKLTASQTATVSLSGVQTQVAPRRLFMRAFFGTSTSDTLFLPVLKTGDIVMDSLRSPGVARSGVRSFTGFSLKNTTSDTMSRVAVLVAVLPTTEGMTRSISPLDGAMEARINDATTSQCVAAPLPMGTTAVAIWRCVMTGTLRSGITHMTFTNTWRLATGETPQEYRVVTFLQSVDGMAYSPYTVAAATTIRVTP